MHAMKDITFEFVPPARFKASPLCSLPATYESRCSTLNSSNNNLPDKLSPLYPSPVVILSTRNSNRRFDGFKSRDLRYSGCARCDVQLDTSYVSKKRVLNGVVDYPVVIATVLLLRGS
jgi:hypothetical protein